MKTVKVISALMLFISAALAAFGYWGYYTLDGRKYFDGMAGMIPYFSLIASVAIFLLTTITLLWLKFRSSNGKDNNKET